MSEYSDSWAALDAPEGAAERMSTHKMLADNADKLALTPAEQYSMGWGPEALSADWVKNKSAVLQKQIENSASMAVLRKGLTKSGNSAATGDKPVGALAGAAAAANAANVNDRNGGGSSGGNGSSGRASDGMGSSDTNTGMNNIGTGFGFSAGDAVKAGVKGFAAGGLPAALVGALMGGLSYTDNSKVNGVTMAEANAPGGFMSTAPGMAENDTRINNPSAYSTSKDSSYGGSSNTGSSSATGGDTAAGRTNDRGGYGDTSGGESSSSSSSSSGGGGGNSGGGGGGDSGRGSQSSNGGRNGGDSGGF